ncbi:hypothetical protein CDL12_03117 [Handroanthus impetiginosus]|uniref:Protein dehydration-induced 19 C-terminal domain-containing protein n=1 Tax=Handroanthus impetiginosus TaxID=429701 RepID=A0A2G9I325_9LAMI|nr:hypothetical protein CDL12_03117 [Handroanthus impetiginosus]
MADRFHDDLEIAVSSYFNRRADFYNEEEEDMDGDYDEEEVYDMENEEKLEELACPFCLEDFDVLGLCCHIDADHRMEVKPGICPVCVTKVGINMASHVITQHESILKALCNKKYRTSRSRSAIFLLRKELQERQLCLMMESPSVDPASDAAADSMLLSFVNNPQPAYKPQTVEADSPTEQSFLVKSSSDYSTESIPPSLSTNGKNERARRCEFSQGLLLSTIFGDL